MAEVRAYLGLCNYYSGYIQMYAGYATPRQQGGDQEAIQEDSTLE